MAALGSPIVGAQYQRESKNSRFIFNKYGINSQIKRPNHK